MCRKKQRKKEHLSTPFRALESVSSLPLPSPLPTVSALLFVLGKMGRRT